SSSTSSLPGRSAGRTLCFVTLRAARRLAGPYSSPSSTTSRAAAAAISAVRADGMAFILGVGTKASRHLDGAHARHDGPGAADDVGGIRLLLEALGRRQHHREASGGVGAELSRAHVEVVPRRGLGAEQAF